MADTVSLEELGPRLGGSVAHALEWCARLDVQARPDWSGRLAVPVSDAARIVDAADIARAERVALMSRHRQYQSEHARVRHQVAVEAFRGEYATRTQRERVVLAEHATAEYAYMGLPNGPLRGSPESAERARQAQNAALEKWDKKHPLYDYEQFSRKGSNLD